jgi:hypothetical protein
VTGQTDDDFTSQEKQERFERAPRAAVKTPPMRRSRKKRGSVEVPEKGTRQKKKESAKNG